MSRFALVIIPDDISSLDYYTVAGKIKGIIGKNKELDDNVIHVVVGGDINHVMRLKENRKYVDCGKVSDIDTSEDDVKYFEAQRFWDYIVVGRSRYDLICNNEDVSYYKDTYRDKDTYCKIKSAFWFDSVITPDGKLYSVDVSDIDALVDWIDNFNKRFVDQFVDCSFAIAFLIEQ